jgi:hypothetical protein
MNSNTAFSLYCGVVLAAFMTLLFGERARAAITSRSSWMADNPRGYMLVIVIWALVLLGSGYIIAKRFA